MSRKLASRSTHGCWTCRLRKKKCDETHPSCLRCTALQIACDGYGPRPYWMDRGELQREQARYMTQVIAQFKSTMRDNGAAGTSQMGEDELDSLVARTIAASSKNPPAAPQEHLPRSGLAPIDERNRQLLAGRDADVQASIEPIWGEALDNASAEFATELFYDQTVRMSSYDPSSSSSDASQTLAMSISPATEESNAPASLDVSRSTSLSEANMDGLDLFYDPIKLSEYCSSEPSGYSSEADWSLCARSTSRSGSTDFVSRPAGLSNPLAHGDVEDILFMYYFDHVFYMHCPFYFPSNRQGRGWLLSILKRVNSAYHAALALSEFHHSTSAQQGSAYPVRTRGGHYDLALKELQTSLARSSAWSGNLGLAHNVELLTTILHLLFYEVSSCRTSLVSKVFDANQLMGKKSHAAAANRTGRSISGERMPCFHRWCKPRWSQQQQEKTK